MTTRKRGIYSKASINGMLSVLQLAISLASGSLPMQPNIKQHKYENLNNERKGFFTDAEFKTLCSHLSDHSVPVSPRRRTFDV